MIARLVGLAALGEELLPGRVDVAGDEVDELRRIVRRRLVQIGRRCARRLRELARARVDAEAAATAPRQAAGEEIDDEQDVSPMPPPPTFPIGNGDRRRRGRRHRRGDPRSALLLLVRATSWSA